MKIAVGKVIKAQGIKGEIKVSCLVDHSKQLKDLKQVYVGETLMDIQAVRVENAEICFVKLAQVTDRNLAETLRDAFIYAEKSQLKLDVGRYFIDDLLGCNVKTSSRNLGEVISIAQGKSADVYSCSLGDVKCSFPFLKRMIVSIDVGKKEIVLDESALAEVIMYED